MNVSRVLALVAASLFVTAPLEAFAQEEDASVSVRDRARPEYDPVGMRLGGFDLNADLGVFVTFTDNVFAAPTNEQSDTIYTLSPLVRLDSHWSRHALAFRVGGDFRNFSDFSSEDANTDYVAGFGRLDVGSRSNVSLSARYADEVEPRTNPDAVIGGAPVEYTRQDYILGAEHRFNRVLVRGAIGAASADYDRADQKFRNYDEQTFTGRVQADITPRIAAVLQTTLDERDYDNSPGLSSDGRTYLAGVSIDFTDLMRGELTVGQFNRDYDSGDKVDGAAVAGSLEWYVTRLTTINLSAGRSAEDSGATLASPYVQTSFGARVDHELLRNLIATAGISGGKRDYQVVDRNDDYWHGEIGADYLLNRRVALRGRYEHDETESSGAAAYRDFEVNALTFGVILRL